MVSIDPKLTEYTGFTSTQKVGGVNPFSPSFTGTATGVSEQSTPNYAKYDTFKVPVVHGSGNDENTSKIGEKFFGTSYLCA